MRETAKMIDGMCMEFQCSVKEGADGGNALKEHTPTTTTNASSEDESSAA